MEDESASLPASKPSKVPSWIMLGFIMGCLAMLSLQREPDVVPDDSPPKSTPASEPPEPPRENIMALSNRPSLAAIEAVFAQWGDYALWENDTTQVALWNSSTSEFSDHLEVVRTPRGLYFRSIPRVTRPWTEARPPVESPFRFTEPEESRRARLEGKLGRQPAPVPPIPSGDSSIDLRPDYLPPPPVRPKEEL